MENPRQQIDANPWKGLNFYSEIDRNNFYGRDEEIQSLSLYITNNIQTILYGKSGIGKSSIIYAGVFPAARQAGLFPISIRFSHDEKTNYIEQIRLAFERAGIGITERVPRIVGHEESLWEFMHRHSFLDPVTDEPTRPLIVMDQFEEIFTLQKDEKKKLAFFAELADLLNGVTPKYIVDAQSTSTSTEKKTKKGGFVLDLGTSNEDEAENDYINESLFNLVFVIREDFLSYMERYTKFIPVMKTNRYALLPLNEEQAADIIMKPQPGLVSKDVTKLIIQKVTSRTDFELEGTPEIEVDAAVLSLFLSGLYRKKEEQGLQTITAELVNQAGEFIIRDFYMDSINGLSEHDIEVLEDELLTSDGRRNNVSKNDLIGEGISEEAIKDLVENQKLLRQFSYQDDIRIEYMHDILCPVVSERIEQRENAKRMEAERLRQEEEQRRLLAEEQRKREAIEAKAKADKERLEKEAIEIRSRVKRRFAIFASLVVGIALLYGIWAVLYVRPYHEYYGNFTTVNGWPVGLGKSISKTEGNDSLIVYYCLTRRGALPEEWRGRPFTEVRVLSGAADSSSTWIAKCWDWIVGNAPTNMTTNKFIESPVVGLIEAELDDENASSFAKLQGETAWWLYSAGDLAQKEVSRCTAYDLQDNELYSIQYSKDKTYNGASNEQYVRWAVFTDKDSRPLMVTDCGIDRMRETVKDGLVTSQLFFTEIGTPQPNSLGIYGYQYEVDNDSHFCDSTCMTNKFGIPDKQTNIRYYYDQYGRIAKTSTYEAIYIGKEFILYKHSNYTDTLQFYEDGTLRKSVYNLITGELCNNYICNFSKVVIENDFEGRLTLIQKYLGDSLAESRRYTYEPSGMLSQIEILKDEVSYIEKHTTSDDQTEIISFWQNNEPYAVERINENGDPVYFHKQISSEGIDTIIKPDKRYKTTTVSYLDENNQPLVCQESYEYTKYILYRDSSNNIRLGYYFDTQGNICKSEWFDYDEYGNKTAQAVAGIEGDPVRAPKWSWDGLCYYKMAMILSSHKKYNRFLLSAEGLNEFEEAGFITGYNEDGEWVRLEIREEPYPIYLVRKNITYVNIAKTVPTQIDNTYTTVCSIHILSRNSTAFHRLKDGDILLTRQGSKLSPANYFEGCEILNKAQQAGSEIWVARPYNKAKTYKITTITLPTGSSNAELVPFVLTPQEEEILNHSLKNQK
jgi:hypothetical protein